MCLLGCDIGSSSVKASIVDKDTGLTLASDFYPKEEAAIKAVRPRWAEQNPDDWWMYLKEAIKGAIAKAGIKGNGDRCDRHLVPDAWARIGGQEDAGAASVGDLVRQSCGALWGSRFQVDRRKAMPGTSFEFSRKLYGFQIGMGKRV